MITYLHSLSFGHWLALATLLLIFEVFGAGGYLLWVGLIAVGVGALTFLVPELHWAWQFMLFGALGMLSAVLWRRHQRRSAR